MTEKKNEVFYKGDIVYEDDINLFGIVEDINSSTIHMRPICIRYEDGEKLHYTKYGRDYVELYCLHKVTNKILIRKYKELL